MKNLSSVHRDAIDTATPVSWLLQSRLHANQSARACFEDVGPSESRNDVESKLRFKHSTEEAGQESRSETCGIGTGGSNRKASRLLLLFVYNTCAEP